MAGCANSTDTFGCLVAADAGTLEGANVVINEAGFFGTFVLVPVIDGDFIVERPVQTILKGKLNGVRHFVSSRGYLKLMIKSIRRFSLR